jgi:DNA-binding transcriptional LysR family regulator
MQQIDWSDYQFFLEIARAGTLAKAAEFLGVDATTASRRLRRLEARLGTTLFERTREGQVLSEQGEALLAKVEAMARAAMTISEPGAQEPADKLAGVLRISASEGFGSWFLARHVPEFVTAHPLLTLDLVASSGFLSLSKREADIAVMLSRPRAGPVIARKLSDYTLRLYAKADYLETAGRPFKPDELRAKHRLVGYIPDLIYAPELSYLNEIQSALAPELRSSSINAQHHLIAAGAGIGVLPCFMGDADPALERVLPEVRIVRSFWLVTHQDTHQFARIRAGRDWIMQIVEENRSTLTA